MNTGMAARVAYNAGELPAVTTHRWALITGFAGGAANLVLILFFLLAQPWRWPDSPFAWLGPVNDALIVAQFAALVPVAVAVRDRLGAGRLLRIATAVGVAAMGAIVVLQLALLAGALGFDVQAPLVIAGQLMVYGWLLVVSRARAMPPGPARFGAAVATSAAAGTGIAAIALLAPWGSPIQFIGFVVAVLIGLFGWLGFPVWPLLVARRMFKEET